MLRIIAVRHGQTEWNVQRRVQGGGAFTHLGRAQVAALAERLRSEPLVAVYCSPALRTRRTARPAAALHGLPVRLRRGLRDLDYGVFTDMYAEDALAQDPQFWAQWQSAPHTVHFPQGGSLAELRRRMKRFMAEVAARHPSGVVLVVTHDSPVRTLASIVLGLKDAAHRRFQVQPASMTVIEFTEAGPRLLALNDTGHLHGIDAH